MENNGQIIIYQSEDGQTHLEVKMVENTVWLTQAQMTELYGVNVSGISRHISNILKSGELDEESNLQKMQIANSDKPVAFYSLDMILSVGYRVNGSRAAMFRRWATQILHEFITKGFALDDNRLKGYGGGAYWNELLNRIRDIRSSEKVMYRQVLDLYATAVDYDPRSEVSIMFFKIVQNKLHYATHGKTAAEVIFDRADAEQPFMGMTSFKGSWPTLADAKIAKNYLSADELKILNRLVSGYFDFAEIQALRHVPMYMSDYVKQLDNILSANGDLLLTDAGKVSHDEAMEKATAEYRKWQNATLSPVEQAYLETIKMLGKKGKNK